MSSRLRYHAIALSEAFIQPILALPRAQPFIGLKRLILRVFGVQLGKGVIIYPGVWIMPPSKKLIIGDRVDLSKDVMITVGATVTIGDKTLIGYGSKILSSNHVIPRRGSAIMDAGHSVAPVTIGSDVWIGANVIVLPGVTIGDGTVVGAGAVVSRSLPANVIAVGAPAHVVRSRD